MNLPYESTFDEYSFFDDYQMFILTGTLKKFISNPYKFITLKSIYISDYKWQPKNISEIYNKKSGRDIIYNKTNQNITI